MAKPAALKHFHPDDRFAVFIDGANLYQTAKALGYDVDYRRLLEVFSGCGRLLRAYYYTALLDEQEYSPIRPLVDWLDYNGYTMVTKPLKEFSQGAGRRKFKGNMDVELTVDVMEITGAVDHVVLMTGDGDFRRLVEAVQRIAGNGTGDTRWKVPGVLDWSTGVYNPDVEISRDTTTLYASDRDVFLFLVDDHNPIEAGRLPDGSPDLYFRGFYCFCIKPTPFRALSKKFHRQEHASVRSRRRGRHTMPFCAEPGDPIWKTRDGRKDRAHDSRTGLAWLASRRRDLFDHAEWPAVRAVYVAGWASPAPNSNSVPSTHILCINTASLRANATLARLAPRRFTSRSAQAFKADGLTRNVMIAFAAS